MAVLQRTENLKTLLGEKKVWIPLAVVALCITLSKSGNFADFLAGVSLAVMLFILYMAVNSKLIDKEKLWKPFAIAAVIESVSIS